MELKTLKDILREWESNLDNLEDYIQRSIKSQRGWIEYFKDELKEEGGKEE